MQRRLVLVRQQLHLLQIILVAFNRLLYLLVLLLLQYLQKGLKALPEHQLQEWELRRQV
jgi:hypothetical protein